MDTTVLLLLSGAGGAIVGGLVAGWLGRGGGRAARERAGELEIEVAKLRSELDARRAQVSSHFVRTSDLFRDLTERYTQLYAHLADGARQFCPDELPAIARGLDGLLPAGGEEASRSAGDEAAAERSGS